MSIQIKQISKSFGSYQALNNIDLTIPTGELVALLGPSGSGKTTLLRIIAGLEQADQGSIYLDQKNMTDSHVKERNVGFVFQHYALFRHMTVFDNIAFGLKVRPRKERPSKEKIREKVFELLKLVKLESFSDRYPTQLSGGQRQRVALARALAVEPKVLLLDEPFGALDAKVRKDLRRWLRQLHNEIPITSVFVTHDQEEALDVADRIVVMNNGGIEQIGTPEEVYDYPANPFVYHFLGNVNLFQGRIQQGKMTFGDVILEATDDKKMVESQVVAFARPHNIKIERAKNEGQAFPARIEHIRSVGPIVHLELSRTDTKEFIEAELSKEEFRALKLQAGEKVFVNPKDMKVFLQEEYTI
ncbi:sulfate/molybdate ABC transporter ATP-binding protein [Caldalkalibacillus mannanilyticus]|uniref:sulfate/molybdate ABC transporter ATP-binding protein n=1 Tax=Caldalkalibacillus mannanilyticus TaxID=1418 RepID=UPI000469CFA3|nr:sulfate/molybdate ABC transporter ATP-binding protein [Caldalkalibacillus mannanilyticus]